MNLHIREFIFVATILELYFLRAWQLFNWLWHVPNTCSYIFLAQIVNLLYEIFLGSLPIHHYRCRHHYQNLCPTYSVNFVPFHPTLSTMMFSIGPCSILCCLVTSIHVFSSFPLLWYLLFVTLQLFVLGCF